MDFVAEPARERPASPHPRPSAGDVERADDAPSPAVRRLNAGAAAALQRQAGNRAVSRLVAQRRAKPAPAKPAPARPRAAAAPATESAGTNPSTAAGGAASAAVETASPELPVQRLTDGKSGARSGPGSDPKFTALKRDVTSKQQTVGKHPPPASEASAAQGAAKPPQDDKEAQGKTANAEKMNAAKPGEFDKAAFIRAVNDAIAKQAPKNLDEADKFGDSGKADAVKGEVQGKVGAGKQASANAIETTTNAPPDTAAAKEKQVTPLRPDQPPPTPGAPNPSQAVPDKAPPSATDFSDGPKQVDKQMSDAQVTEEQLARSNEPEFTGALKDKKEGEKQAATSPGVVRAGEDKTLSGAKAQAAQAGAAAMTSMAGARVKAGKEVGAGKEGAKGDDESKRTQVTAELQKVFDATKKDVEDILGGLDKKVDEKFTSGEKAARDAFTADYTRKIDAYKDKRYSGLLGKGRWIKDQFAGLPDEVNAFYAQARQGYVTSMQGVISSVADVIGAELTRAKQRIAKGRDDLQAEVKKLPADLQAIGKQAAGEFAGRFDELTQQVNDKGTELVDTLASKYTEALKAVDEQIAAEKEKNKGLIAKAVDAVKGVIDTILKLKDLLLGVLAKAAQAVTAIIKDPIGFLGKLVSAVGAGLKSFLANIASHLQKGLVSWLLGAAAKAGLQLPERFDLKGILLLIGSLLGLTWSAIRGRIVQRGVPEQAMTTVESSVPVAQKIKNEGIGGIWEDIKEKVGDLKAGLLGKIAQYLIPTVIIAGITWIISLLNPASAFVKACKAIIDIVTFIIERGAQIVTFVNAVLDAVIAIAGGGAGGVPGLIENALALSIPVLIGFLAALLGIGGLADKVKKLFQSLSKPVMKAVDWVVGKIVKFGKKLWAKLKAPGKKVADKFGRKDKKKESTGNDVSPKVKAATLKAASAEARNRLAAGAEVEQMQGVLGQVHQKYAGEGLSSLRMVKTGGPHTFRVEAHGSPHESSDEIAVDSPNVAKGDSNALRWTEDEIRTWKTEEEKREERLIRELHDEARAKLKAELEGPAKKKQKTLPRDDAPPTVARGTLTWKVGNREDITVRKHRSKETPGVYEKYHEIRDAHAEEHVTVIFQNEDLQKMPAQRELVERISVRYEVNRSPCVNCADYIGNFVHGDLAARSATVNASVAASSLYQGQSDFTGEIRQRYPRIFNELVKDKSIEWEREFQEARKEKTGKKPANRPRRFTGHPRSQTQAETKRRRGEWEKVPVVGTDYRPEWFRISRGHDSGTAGIAILKARGITVSVLDAATAGIRDPDSNDPMRDLTPEEQKLMTEEEKDKRREFLRELQIRNDILQEKIKVVEDAGVDDSWVVSHGRVGS